MQLAVLVENSPMAVLIGPRRKKVAVLVVVEVLLVVVKVHKFGTDKYYALYTRTRREKKMAVLVENSPMAVLIGPMRKKGGSSGGGGGAVVVVMVHRVSCFSLCTFNLL